MFSLYRRYVSHLSSSATTRHPRLLIVRLYNHAYLSVCMCTACATQRRKYSSGKLQQYTTGNTYFYNIAIRKFFSLSLSLSLSRPLSFALPCLAERKRARISAMSIPTPAAQSCACCAVGAAACIDREISIYIFFFLPGASKCGLVCKGYIALCSCLLCDINSTVDLNCLPSGGKIIRYICFVPILRNVLHFSLALG